MPQTLEKTENLQAITPRRALIALGAGNALEWYDWIIYGLLAVWIGPKFFPSDDPTTPLLSALAVFAVGFAARPLGGIILGTIADRIGRRKVMLIAVGSMAAASLTIAAMPTYDQIGVWAGIILVACRIVQGLSTGAEAPLTAAYVVEVAPSGREGWFGGVIGLMVNLGILAASLVTYLLSAWWGAAAMAENGWRVPVLIGGIAGLVVLWLRRRLPETLTVDSNGMTPRASEVWREVWRNKLALLAITFVVAGAQVLNYGWTVGLPGLATGAFKEDPTAVFGLSTLLGVVLMGTSLVGGLLADRWRLSRTFVVLRLLAIPAPFLLLLYTQPGLSSFALVLLVGGIIVGLNMAIYNVVTGTLMPMMCRAAGVSLGYGIGVSLFGGTASFILVWLRSQGMSWAFPIYVAVLCLLGVLTYLAAKKRGQIYAAE